MALPPSLGKLDRRTGKREQAQEHLTTATTMYCEMGMTYWLNTAEAEVSPHAFKVQFGIFKDVLRGISPPG